MGISIVGLLCSKSLHTPRVCRVCHCSNTARLLHCERAQLLRSLYLFNDIACDRLIFRALSLRLPSRFFVTFARVRGVLDDLRLGSLSIVDSSYLKLSLEYKLL